MATPYYKGECWKWEQNKQLQTFCTLCCLVLVYVYTTCRSTQTYKHHNCCQWDDFFLNTLNILEKYAKGLNFSQSVSLRSFLGIPQIPITMWGSLLHSIPSTSFPCLLSASSLSTIQVKMQKKCVSLTNLNNFCGPIFGYFNGVMIVHIPGEVNVVINKNILFYLYSIHQTNYNLSTY